MRGFNKNNVTPPEVKKDKKKKKDTLATEYIRLPSWAIHFALHSRAERLINPRAFPERTVMKMPPEYFTCPFNTSTDGAEERKVRTKRGRGEGTKEELLYSRCRNRRRGKSAVKESLFHLCVCYALCSARFFSFITFNSSDTMPARGISLSRFTLHHHEIVRSLLWMH